MTSPSMLPRRTTQNQECLPRWCMARCVVCVCCDHVPFSIDQLVLGRLSLITHPRYQRENSGKLFDVCFALPLVIWLLRVAMLQVAPLEQSPLTQHGLQPWRGFTLMLEGFTCNQEQSREDPLQVSISCRFV